MAHIHTTFLKDIDTHDKLQKERHETFQLKEFKQWCEDMNIGVRVEKENDSRIRAYEMNMQYADNYPKWVQRMF
jgi:hypothetical protein